MVKHLFLPYFFCIFVAKYKIIYKNMEKFYTQVCTTIEQSKQLIDLGINPDTADMGWFKAYSLKGEIYKPFIKEYKLENYKTDIPAWSLHCLLKMLPEETYIDGELIELLITPNAVAYQNEDYFIMAGGISGENIYGDIINCLEYLVKEEKIKY